MVACIGVPPRRDDPSLATAARLVLRPSRPFTRHMTHVPPHRPARHRTAQKPTKQDPASAAAVQELLGGQVRRDVHADELHLPVVQLPRPRQRPAVLRPHRQHRRRGVRPHRAGLRHHQHAAHRSPTRRRRRPPAPRSATARTRGNRHHFIASGPGGAAAATRMGNPWTGDYVFSSGNLDRSTCCTTSSWRAARAPTSCASTR